MQNKYEKLFLCIFSVQSVNASFSLKMPISYLHVFYFAIEEKKTILWIYMPCSAALEMHIQQRIKRFRERRSSLNSWEVKSEKNVANISFIGIHKGSLHSNIIFTRHKILHFILFFNGKAEGQIIIFSPYLIYPLPSHRSDCIQKELYGHKRWLHI